MTKLESDEPAKVVRVIAKYNFEGRNNDELSFLKNDVIIVTQQLDEGGWWEGSLGDNVGWFPSDFVGIIKTQSNGKTDETNLSMAEFDETFETTRLKFRNEILRGNDGFMTKETEHIAKLNRFLTDFLPLILFRMMSSEFRTISTNILQIIDAKKKLFDQLDSELKKDVSRQEIGAIFLDRAANFKNLLFSYCANHPSAMALLLKKKDSIAKVLKSKGIEIKDFIAGLSLVFRHTEKYSAILQEVERNTSSAHPDRGNLQRACAVYRDIAEDCLAIRKQKEMQLEFLNSGFLEKTFGKNYEQKLGPIIHVSSVTLNFLDSANNEEVFDRCFVLFRLECLFLEVTNEKNMFILKEQFPTAGFSIQCKDTLLQILFLKDSKPTFTLNSLTVDDYRRLVSVLREFSFEEVVVPNTPYNIQECSSVSPQRAETEQMTSISPSKQIEFANLPQSKKAVSKNQITKDGNIVLNHQVEMILPDGAGDTFAQKPPIVPNSSVQRISRSTKLYSGWCLKPIPAFRGTSSNGLQSTASASSIKLRKGLTIEEQEDAYLLKIVEGYCSSSCSNGLSGSFSRMNISTMSNYPLPRRATSYPEEMRPQLIVANDEKIFVEEVEGNETVMKEKSLVDTVYQLQSQVSDLQKELLVTKQNVSNEQKARRRLEEAFRRLSNNFSHASSPKPAEESVDS